MKMKKTAIAACVVSLLMVANGAMASMSPEIQVKGKMAVPSCTVSLVNNGVFDLGKISNGLIKPSSATTLAAVGNQLSVDCDAETFLNFTVVDNREGTASVASGQNFGLGSVNGTGKLGYYVVELKDPLVNSSSAALYSTNKGSSSFSVSQNVTADKNKVMGWARSNNVQASGKKFYATLKLTPVLASSQDMGGPITDSVTLDGSATLSFAYGI